MAAVTLVCCLLAIRWAVDQFNHESVLFRESERLDLRRWLVHLVRDRGDTPSFAQAMLCVAVILVVQFFMSVSMSAHAPDDVDVRLSGEDDSDQPDWLHSGAGGDHDPDAHAAARARRCCWIGVPRLRHIVAAVALALLVHPAGDAICAKRFTELYPPCRRWIAAKTAIEALLAQAPHWWMRHRRAGGAAGDLRGARVPRLRAVGPAARWAQVVGDRLSAVAFGGVHMFLQQKIVAAVVGVVIGYLAVQTGSLWPGVVFHAIHNSLQLLIQRWAGAVEADPEAAVRRRSWLATRRCCIIRRPWRRVRSASRRSCGACAAPPTSRRAKSRSKKRGSGRIVPLVGA